MAYARRNEGFKGGRGGGFNKGFKGGNSFGGGRGRGFSDRGGDRPAMFPATCGDCGSSCEVPFRPNGKKPVLCKSCFGKGGDFVTKSEGRGNRAPTYNGGDHSSELRTINAKLDAILKALNTDRFSL